MNDKTLPQKVSDGLLLAAIKTEDATTNVSEGYSDDTSLRLLVRTIPLAGPALDLVLSEPGSRARRQRIGLFLEELASDMKRFAQEKVDRRFLDTPEFEGVVETIVGAAATTSLAAKREILRAAVIGAIVLPFSEDPLLDTFVTLVEVLSVDHIVRLKQFEYLATSETFFRSTTQSADSVLGPQVHQAEAALFYDLIGRGLVEEAVVQGWGNMARQEPGYRLTPLGMRFLSFLKVQESVTSRNEEQDQ